MCDPAISLYWALNRTAPIMVPAQRLFLECLSSSAIPLSIKGMEFDLSGPIVKVEREDGGTASQSRLPDP